ncbi:hypothetical protein WAC51_03135 [Stenotrophomonas geniculata]|uniref:hypothetical protein n=1 Tax=Stenotrophomonas geniculata TaxID=86188 RepID=UPI0030D5B30E
MNKFYGCHQWMSLLIMIMGLLGVIGGAKSLDLKITGEYKPSPLEPGNGQFKDTTPRHNYCTRPGCRPSIRLDALSIRYPQGIDNGAVGRDSFYFRMPSVFRTVTLVHDDDGSTVDARWRIDSFTGSIGARPASVRPTGYLAPSPCALIHGRGGSNWFDFQWRLDDGGLACAKTVHADLPPTNFSYFGISYELQFPNAASMHNGRYAGVIQLTMGPGGDIDFGDRAVISDSILNVVIELEVQHQFVVRFPAEHPRVLLSPEKGWSQWVDHGFPPAYLRQELSFFLTSSMDLSLKLRCEYDIGNRCGISNTKDGTVVPVDVDVTIPGMSNLRDGRPAQRTALEPDDGQAPRFTPDGYLIQRRSTLRFTAGKEAVAEMLNAPDSRWEGNMTLIFDADP